MSESGVHIPEELVTHLLSFLPVKSLVRFKCVSKEWLALIDSPEFIKRHLSQSLKTLRNLNIILSIDSSFHSADLDSLQDQNGVACPIKLNPPPFPLASSSSGEDSPIISVLGSCNGLLYLSTSTSGGGDIIIWNPYTRKHQKLPRSPPIVYSDDSVYIPSSESGFGYDSVHDDYKLVRVAQFHLDWDSEVFRNEVKVYSLKSNQWRKVQGDCPYFIRPVGLGGTYASDRLHWVAGNVPRLGSPNLIAAFNLSNDDWNVLPLPKDLEGNFFLNLVNLGGSIAMFCSYCRVCVDVWVMKEYGVRESWVKICSVAQPAHIRSFELNPLAYSNDDKRVLFGLDSSSLVWFDLQNKSVRGVRISGGVPKIFNTDFCLASLVKLPDSDAHQLHLEKKNNNREKQKASSKGDNFLSSGFKLRL